VNPADTGSGEDSKSGVVPGELFKRLWDTLSDLLGSAATAILVRRALARSLPACPELHDLLIARGNLEYRYTLPRSWSEPTPAALAELRVFLAALWPLLEEMTGPIALERLLRIPGLVTISPPAGPAAEPA
jgi:hypothetical protein